MALALVAPADTVLLYDRQCETQSKSCRQTRILRACRQIWFGTKSRHRGVGPDARQNEPRF